MGWLAKGIVFVAVLALGLTYLWFRARSRSA